MKYNLEVFLEYSPIYSLWTRPMFIHSVFGSHELKAGHSQLQLQNAMKKISQEARQHGLSLNSCLLW